MIFSACSLAQPRMRTFALKANFFRITKRCQFIFHINVMICRKMRKVELKCNYAVSDKY